MFLSIRRDETKRLPEKLSRSSSQGGFFKVELKTMFSELTFNIMMRMVAGKWYYRDDVEDEEEASRFRKIMKEAISYGVVSNPGDFLLILNWIDGRDFTNEVVSLSKRVDEFLQGMIDEHRIKKVDLGGDAADFEARAAKGTALLDTRGLEAELGGFDGGDIASESTSVDDDGKRERDPAFLIGGF
ncbi:hypothetical protein EZV62_013918 [Acer yangbiense]|uniref:Uncharacterized protein n=1 Tax=Acer yangbiense TaxID=1000413 RepID=A0A5C7HRB4_9ROSI|nr:hypothetical protein EZV62_013918 [Acer yangbiense]